MLSDADLKRISDSVNCDIGTLTDHEIKLRRTVRDLLAEIERLRGALAARPVLQSRNKSNAIRIGAAESLIPKEKD